MSEKNNNTSPQIFEGMLLDEVLTCDFVKPNSTLVLKVETKPGDKSPTVKSGVYEPRVDGCFDLKVVFPGSSRQPKLADLISQVLNHPELPDYLDEKIQEAINDMYNHGDTHQYERSAQYVGAVIDAYTNSERKGKSK